MPVLLCRLQQEGEVVVTIRQLVLSERPCSPTVHTTHTHLTKVDVDVCIALAEVFGMVLTLAVTIVEVAHLVVQCRSREECVGGNVQSVVVVVAQFVEAQVSLVSCLLRTLVVVELLVNCLFVKSYERGALAVVVVLHRATAVVLHIVVSCRKG